MWVDTSTTCVQYPVATSLAWAVVRDTIDAVVKNRVSGSSGRIVSKWSGAILASRGSYRGFRFQSVAVRNFSIYGFDFVCIPLIASTSNLWVLNLETPQHSNLLSKLCRRFWRSWVFRPHEIGSGTIYGCKGQCETIWSCPLQLTDWHWHW